MPSLDNGEWFWALYSAAVALRKHENNKNYKDLGENYWKFVNCQRNNAKTIFYRGNGDVSEVVDIMDPFNATLLNDPDNYQQSEGSKYLNDPYEGETMTQLLYLFSDFETEDERELLWVNKRGMLQASTYKIDHSNCKYMSLQNKQIQEITVQVSNFYLLLTPSISCSLNQLYQAHELLTVMLVIFI